MFPQRRIYCIVLPNHQEPEIDPFGKQGIYRSNQVKMRPSELGLNPTITMPLLKKKKKRWGLGKDLKTGISTLEEDRGLE
jgi:hypothetical protein